MGDCGRGCVAHAQDAPVLDKDMSIAHGIAKRFEQLETRWLSFQKESAKWEANKDTLQIVSGCLAQAAHLEDPQGQPTASSYSNPLFTNRPSRRLTLRATAAAAINLDKPSSYSPPRLSHIHHDLHITPIVLSSGGGGGGGGAEDDAAAGALKLEPVDSSTSAQVSPAATLTSVSSSTCNNPTELAAATAAAATAKSPKFVRSRPAAAVAVAVAAKPYAKSSSLPAFYHAKHNTRLSAHKMSHNFLEVGDATVAESPHDLAVEDDANNIPSREFAGLHADMNEIKRPAGLDPATYSSGKGPPTRLRIPMYDHACPRGDDDDGDDDAHDPHHHDFELMPCFSRSPPQPIDPEEEFQLEHLSFGGDMPRNVKWRVIADRGILSEGVIRNPKVVEEVSTKAEPPCTKDNLLKLEVEVDKKDVLELDPNKRLSDRLRRARWELRLSKREAALRVAEEKLLEDQKKLDMELSHSLAPAHAPMKHENENQRIMALAESLRSMEPGRAAAMKSLNAAAVKEAVRQVGEKETAIQAGWGELKVGGGGGRDGSQLQAPDELWRRGEEPARRVDDEGPLSAGDEWAATVMGVCERLVAYMDRERELQKWTMALRKEGERIATAEAEAAKGREAFLAQQAASEALSKSAADQSSGVEEDRAKLAGERQKLVLWVTHLQERHKAVTECELEAATALAAAHQRGAELAAQAGDASARQEAARADAQRVQEERALVDRERSKVQEKQWQVAAMEREVESKLLALQQSQAELDARASQLERERSDHKIAQDQHLDAHKEIETRLAAKELVLRVLEKELDGRSSTTAAASEERSKLQEVRAELERERIQLQKVEDAISESQIAKKNADDAWARAVKEQGEAAEYLHSVEERVKSWEDELCLKESELLQQQRNVENAEAQARQDHQHSKALQEKLVREQKKWGNEMKAKQEGMTKRAEVLDTKEAEIRRDLEKLMEERRRTIEEIKRFAEMESRAWAAEKELQEKHEQHLEEVNQHAKEYHGNMEALAAAKSEVDKELIDVHAMKQDFEVRQREAEESLQRRIDAFNVEKEELCAHFQELRKLQAEIEQAGGRVMERVAELDQAAAKLDLQRQKVEKSKGKLEKMADKLAAQHDVLKQRECDLKVQEVKVVAVQGGVKRMAAETSSKEKKLRVREQSVVDSEKNLHEVEERVAKEKRDLEKMIAEVEQHATTLRDEAAAIEDSTRKCKHEEKRMEERQEQLQDKERELAEYEEALKKKARILEEHGQTISKLEMQVKERFHRAAAKELKHSELEKGRERLKEEQAAIAREKELLQLAKADLQRAAECQAEDSHAKEESEKKAWVDEMEQLRAEMVKAVHEREAAVEAREAQASEREADLARQEQERKEKAERDVHALKLQVAETLHTLDEKQKAADATAASLEDRAASLESRERALEQREAAAIAATKENANHNVRISAAFDASANSTAATFVARPTGASQYLFDLPASGKEINTVKSVHWLDDTERGNWPRGLSENDDEAIKELGGQYYVSRVEEVGREESRLRQMEASIRKEAAHILQERANLQAQQQDLEETRKAVQEVKMTLTAQLKATKQMVEDASLTAHAATREREALEEERNQLLSAQQECEASFAEKQASLAREAAHLQRMKETLEQEKAQALEVIERAAAQAAAATDAERGARARMGRTSSIALFETAELALDSGGVSKKRERPETDSPHLEATHESKKLNSEDGGSGGAAARSEPHQQHSTADAVEIADLHGGEATAHYYSPRTHLLHREEPRALALSARVRKTWDGGWPHQPRGGAGAGDNANKKSVDNTDMNQYPKHLAAAGLNACGYGVHRGTGAELAPQQQQQQQVKRDTAEKALGLRRERRELEAVMTHLVHKRHACVSQLQQVEKRVFSFPPSAFGFTVPVQQGLGALSARLGLMEQIEDGLELQLRAAFDHHRPGAASVDRAQLLSRMHEQQSLRAEWEADLQRQVDTIAMLQAPSFFHSPRTPPPPASPPLSLSHWHPPPHVDNSHHHVIMPSWHAAAG